MLRVIVAAILGGVLLTVWEGASWMATDIHHLDPHPQLKDEAAVVKALEGNPRGMFWIPGSDTQEFDPESEAFKAWEERHKAGPRGFVLYDPDGGEPMPASMHVIGTSINILMALMLALLLYRCRVRTFFGRFGAVILVGLFFILGADGKGWNWMGFTDSWTQGNVIDHLVGTGVLALVMAVVVRAPKDDVEPA